MSIPQKIRRIVVTVGLSLITSGVVYAGAQQPASAAAPAAPAPVAATPETAKAFLGDWIATVDAPPGPVQFAFNIKVENNAVVAVINNEMMGSNTAKDLFIDGKALLIKYTADMMGNAAPISLWLTPDQDKLKTDFSFMNGEFQMSGLASKAAK